MTFAAGDANTGAGYGRIPASSGEKPAEKIWPYSEETEEEVESRQYDDETDDARTALHRKKKKYSPSDHLGQLNYHPNAFVKSSTRGLTGIMASVRPRTLIELLEVGFKAAVGQASPSYNMMGSFDSRIRPGRRTGSKQGWFSSPPPKRTDPGEKRRAYTLKDIGLPDWDEPIENADEERRKANDDKKIDEIVLRAYIQNELLRIS